MTIRLNNYMEFVLKKLDRLRNKFVEFSALEHTTHCGAGKINK